MKPKEFWIRQGRCGFTYDKYEPDDLEPPPDFTKGDDFYHMILERPAIGGIHVIEYSAYRQAVDALKVYAEIKNFIKIWNDDKDPTDMSFYEIRGKHSIADFEVRAMETLKDLGELGDEE